MVPLAKRLEYISEKILATGTQLAQICTQGYIFCQIIWSWVWGKRVIEKGENSIKNGVNALKTIFWGIN